MRTIQLTIAMTMLSVPASAFALPGTTSTETHGPTAALLPVAVAPRHVSLGQSVSITGTAASAQAGRRVALQSAPRRHAAWRRLATTRIGRRGRFAFRAHLRHSGVLRAVEIDGPRSGAAARGTVSVPGARPALRSRSVNDTGAAGLASAPTPRGTRAPARFAPVQVTAALRVPARSHDVLSGDDIQVAGRLLPGRRGRAVALQGHGAHGWRTLARARTGGRGGFAVRYRPSSGTDRHLRVVFSGDRANARSVSAAGTMTLYRPTVASWYQDGGSTGCGYHAGLGVANRTLPCGTKVRLRHGGRAVTATVDDRGPYVGGRSYDLNQNTAAALGFAGVGTIWVSVR